MTKKRNTEKALVLSLISMFLCVTMLFGATYAWFSANDEAGVSAITIGGFEVKLVDKDGNDIESLKFYTDEARTTEAGKWEPGATYYLEKFYVKNAGDLDMKYTVTDNFPNDTGLNWTRTGTTETILVNGADAEVDIYCTVSEDLSSDLAGTTLTASDNAASLKIVVNAEQVKATD